MDVRLHGNSNFNQRVNGGARRSSRSGKDDTLKYLSPEEQETLQFFEQTIDSLDDSLEEQENRRSAQIRPQVNSQGPISVVNGPSVSVPNPGISATPHQEIIDLVHPDLDLMPPREPIFNSTNPDFRHMLPAPASHFEIKPRHESMASEYNLPTPNTPPDGHSAYHPPGSVPTPVLIAHQIAENQGGGTTSFHPSTFLRRLSLESEKTQVDGSDHPSRRGPPTSAKPAHLPANISMLQRSREHLNPSGSDETIHDRQESQSLVSPSEHYQQSIETKVRKAPTRSISFKDPTPGKSRMEALSKLGLTRNRAMSGDKAIENKPHGTPMEPLKVTTPGTKTVDTSIPQTTQNNLPEPAGTTPYYFHADRKPEAPPTHVHRSNNTRSTHLTPSSPSITQSRPTTPQMENTTPNHPSEVNSLSFNHYGGKSIMVNSTVQTRSNPPTSPIRNEPKIVLPALSNPPEANLYGGKTKVMNPGSMNRTDLPDILCSHISQNPAAPIRQEPQAAELNSYGGKSLTINPTPGGKPSTGSLSKSIKGPAPTPAPRPARHSYHGALSPPKPAQAPHPERRRSNSMFRPQGITVHFSGRGPMNDSRREALRKLGLLKT